MVFKTQILSKPMESYGFHEVSTIKSNHIIYKILWFRGRLFRVDTGKTLEGTYLPCGGEGGVD